MSGVWCALSIVSLYLVVINATLDVHVGGNRLAGRHLTISRVQLLSDPGTPQKIVIKAGGSIFIKRDNRYQRTDNPGVHVKWVWEKYQFTAATPASKPSLSRSEWDNSLNELYVGHNRPSKSGFIDFIKSLKEAITAHHVAVRVDDKEGSLYVIAPLEEKGVGCSAETSFFRVKQMIDQISKGTFLAVQDVFLYPESSTKNPRRKEYIAVKEESNQLGVFEENKDGEMRYVNPLVLRAETADGGSAVSTQEFIKECKDGLVIIDKRGLRVMKARKKYRLVVPIFHGDCEDSAAKEKEIAVAASNKARYADAEEGDEDDYQIQYWDHLYEYFAKKIANFAVEN